jgi:hypothetical protein
VTRYAVTLDVRGRAVVPIEADSPDDACAKAEQYDPWELEVDVTDTTVEGWELDE